MLKRTTDNIIKNHRDSFELADIRVTKASNASYGSLPNTLHSGKCGVAGNFITLPLDYVIDENDNTTGIKSLNAPQ